MLKELIRQIAEAAHLSEADARHAVGLIFNTAERQDAELIEKVFCDLPGARTLSASTGQREGMATGDIARLIEQTPGGRRHVTLALFARLHALGLGHGQIAVLITTLGGFLDRQFNASAATLISQLFSNMDVEQEARTIAAA